MAPLAGRPPFATDEPDTFYQSSPQPRPRPKPQQPQANRTSAYDVYDNYLAPGDAPANRNSGIDALGMGFMTANMDDSDDDDEEDMRPNRSPSTKPSPSKQAALAAAIGATSSKGPFAPERLETPPPQYNNSPSSQQRGAPSPSRTPTRVPASAAPQMSMPSPTPASVSMPVPRPSPSPPAIAAPRPGYAAPIAVLDQSANGAVSRPTPAAAPAGRAPGNLRIAPPPAGMQFPDPSSQFGGTPSPSSPSPHPLQAPPTPITPVFARPQRSATADSAGSVAFSETKGLILRGEGEETLLTRGRGQKGDQFWRRFSMVAKNPSEKRPSTWYVQNESANKRQRRYIWIIGIILIICAVGGIGIGVYESVNSASHKRPEAIGGSSNEGGSIVPTTAPHTASAKSVGKGAIGASSTPHVAAATNTVARRAAEPLVTVAPRHAARNKARLTADYAL